MAAVLRIHPLLNSAMEKRGRFYGVYNSFSFSGLIDSGDNSSQVLESNGGNNRFDAFGEKPLEKSGTVFYLVRLVIEKAE
jgi:hypothetical protein